MKKPVLLALCMTLLLVLPACGGRAEEEPRLTVVCTTYPIYLFAGIAGIIRGLTLLPLLLFTGYTCGKTWAERWKRWKKGR